ncbi:MAG: hypothetical protein N3D16_02685, partial [Anaerolineales bacterium]|nr:hypothetical protein [Anaerolineales bacterium]
MKILHAEEATFSPENSSKMPHHQGQDEREVNSYLQRVEQILSGVLDHSHTLIYNVSLQQRAIHSPLALLSPSGVTLFFLNHQRGVFRARAREWEKLDERRKQYTPSQPNPLLMASTQVTALRNYLTEQGFPNVNIQATVLFTDPGIHVQAEENEVRLIYLEGIPRFAVSLKRAQPTLTLDEVNALVPLLAPCTLEEALRSREIQDDFSFREEKPRQVQIPQIEIPLLQDDKLVSAIHKVPFSQRQLL